MAHAWHEPEVLGFPGRHVQLAGVLGWEVVVLVAVHDQQWHRRDLRRRLGRRDRDQLPAFRADPGFQPAPGDEPAEPVFHREVYPPHGFGAAVVPAAGTADRHRRVQPADQAGVPQDDRGAHREADRGDLLVAEFAGPRDDHVEVIDLAVAQRGQATGAPVAAEVEGEHARHPVEPVGDPPDVGPLPRQRETVRDHDRKVPLARQVDGVDRHAVLRDQGRCRHDRLGHLSPPTLRLRRGPAASHSSNDAANSINPGPGQINRGLADRGADGEGFGYPPQRSLTVE